MFAHCMNELTVNYKVAIHVTIQNKRLKSAHTLRTVLGEAGRLADRQGLVNTKIHWSPHTIELVWSRILLSVCELQCIKVFTNPCLPASCKTAFSVWAPLRCVHIIHPPRLYHLTNCLSAKRDANTHIVL